MNETYAGYDAWKGWDSSQFMLLTDSQRSYYAMEFQEIPLHGENVLEVGFGSGSLLAWLTEQKATVYGTELSPQGVSLAAERGVIVIDPKLDEADRLTGQFGVVAAFDVLEHLSTDEIIALLDKVAILLRPGGYFVARFPNGGSPFGRSIQHGDVTHVSTLTISKIDQLLAGKPLVLDRAGDAAVPVHGNLPTRYAKRLRQVLRHGFERGLRGLYGLEGPLHPNLTIVLRRQCTDVGK